MALLKGIIAATFTPFGPDGSLQLDVVPAYVDYLIQNGIAGLYVCGTTGEGVNMTVEERQQVAAAFVQAADRRIPVVVQIGANSLADSRKLAAHAQSIKATAVSTNAPSYFRINDAKTLANWVSGIAAAAPETPFYYYHIPSFTGVNIDMTEFLNLADECCPTLAGLKYTDTKVFVFQEALTHKNGKYEVLWGCDEMLLSALAVGATGGVGSTYGLAPALYNDILSSWQNGNLTEARRLQRISWEFVKVMLRYGSLIPVQREVMKMVGIDLGMSRLPLPLFDSSKLQNLRNDLESIHFDQWRIKQ